MLFKIRHSLILVITLFGLPLMVPQTSNAAEQTLKARYQAQNCLETWNDYGANPVFDPATRSYYPTIRYDVNQFGGHGPAAYYKLWYSSGSGIAHATSADGITWTLVNGGANLGGLHNAHHARVLYDANGFGGGSTYYKIWYWDETLLYDPDLSIRYAESVDGITWINDQAVFGGDDTYAWQRGSYGPVDVLYQPGASNTGSNPFNYAYVMYYDGTTGAFEQIGLAYSADGINWTRYSTTAPVFASGSDSSGPWGLPTPWDSSYVGAGTVLRGPDGLYHMWYSGGATAMHLGIGYAESPDGITWTRSPNNPLVSLGSNNGRGPVGSWNADRNYTPVVLYDADQFSGHGEASLYKMWRSGVNAGNYTLGYASSPCQPPQPAPTPTLPPLSAQPSPATISDPAFSKMGELLPGELGLPGEQIIWTITVSNTENVIGSDIVVTDTLQPELHIDSVTPDQGTAAISGQTVTWTIPVMNPGTSATLRIVTTILTNPTDWQIINTATLTEGEVTKSAEAAVNLVTSLPSTGYPPD